MLPIWSPGYCVDLWIIVSCLHTSRWVDAVGAKLLASGGAPDADDRVVFIPSGETLTIWRPGQGVTPGTVENGTSMFPASPLLIPLPDENIAFMAGCNGGPVR